MSRAIMEGRLVPFFGAAVNHCGRPEGAKWEYGRKDYPPDGRELARYLAEYYDYGGTDPQDLVRVSQYVDIVTGESPLFEQLRSIFNVNYPATAVHRFFAGLPFLLRAGGYPRSEDPLRRRQVVITTNYDDLMERAFDEAQEAFHLVSYVAHGRDRGKFRHRYPSGCVQLIDTPNEYRGLLGDSAPIVAKIHGAVDRERADRDSYVVTEDHYIDYLTRTDLARLLPLPLPAKLQNSQFLFLGYSLRDWNLRAILHRLWQAQELRAQSWAVQLKPDDLDKEFWKRRSIEIVDADIGEYMTALDTRVRALLRTTPDATAQNPPAGGGQ